VEKMRVSCFFLQFEKKYYSLKNCSRKNFFPDSEKNLPSQKKSPFFSNFFFREFKKIPRRRIFFFEGEKNSRESEKILARLKKILASLKKFSPVNKNSHEYEKILSSLNKNFHESEKNSRPSEKKFSPV